MLQNMDEIIYESINSIGENNISKSLSNEEKLSLKQIFSHYINDSINLDIEKLNLETCILLDYLFFKGEYVFTKNIITPLDNKDLILSDYKSTERTKYINLFDKLIVLKRYDLLLNNKLYVKENILYDNSFTAVDMENIRNNFPELFKEILSNTKDFILFIFLWRQQEFIDSNIEK